MRTSHAAGAPGDPTRRAPWREGAVSIAAGALLLASCTTSGSGTSAAAQVKRNWVAFFSPHTSTSRKLALLQNGSKFAPVLAQLSSTAASVSSTVQKVQLTSSSTAKVTYTVLLGGAPVLSNQPGLAVKQSGTWKVADSSLCALLSLEQQSVAACSSGATGMSGATGASGASGPG